jgi:cytochrome c556
VNRANPVDLRKSLEVANTLAKHGIGFVCLPTLSDEDRDQLIGQGAERMEKLAQMAEGEQP